MYIYKSMLVLHITVHIERASTAGNAHQVLYDASIRSLQFSACGLNLLITQRCVSRLVHVRVPSRFQLLQTTLAHQAPITCMAMCPDSKGWCKTSRNSSGRRLATGSADGRVIFWNLSSAYYLATLTEHSSRVTCLAFTPDENFLVSGAADRFAIVWNTSNCRVHLKHVRYSIFLFILFRLVRFLRKRARLVCILHIRVSVIVLFQLHDAELTTVSVFGSSDDEEGIRCLSMDATGCMHVWKVASGETLLVLNRSHDNVQSHSPSHASPPSALIPRIIRNDLVLSLLTLHT